MTHLAERYGCRDRTNSQKSPFLTQLQFILPIFTATEPTLTSTQMNNAKHTPGPWAIAVTMKRGEVYGLSIEQSAERYPGNVNMKGVHMQIAKMSIHRRGSSDRIPELNTRADAHNAHEGCQQANAKLIAAAPDLLAALEGMMEWARRVKGSNPGPEVFNACNAIAKATE